MRALLHTYCNATIISSQPAPCSKPTHARHSAERLVPPTAAPIISSQPAPCGKPTHARHSAERLVPPTAAPIISSQPASPLQQTDSRSTFSGTFSAPNSCPTVTSCCDSHLLPDSTGKNWRVNTWEIGVCTCDVS